MRIRNNLRRQLALSGTLAAIGGTLAVAGTAAAVAPAPPANVPGDTLAVQSEAAQNNKQIGPTIADPAAVSTITIPATAQDVIRDVDVQTFIGHTASTDVAIELTSPAGTTVTLVRSPNAAQGNDDSFDGTVWDDSAATLATDAIYPAPGGVVADLVPEGALGAFVGEDPAGIWTLRVTDSSGAADTDQGVLKNWELRLATQASTPAATTTPAASSGPAVAIPDNDPAGATKTVTVSGANAYLTDVDIETDVTHTNPSELEMRLTGPSGRTVVLSTGNTGPTTFYVDRLFDDNAPALITASPLTGAAIPEGALSPFIGTDPNGTWTLSVIDTAAGDTGTIDGFSLSIRSTAGAAAPPTTPPGPATPAPGTPISTKGLCLPSPTPATPNPPSAGKVTVSMAQLRINQRIYQAAVRRANAIQTWLDAGLVSKDFCGGAVGTAQLGPGVTTGTLAPAQTLTTPSPRPVVVAPGTSKPGATFALSPSQLLINQRVAQAAVRRANGLGTRLNGSLTGGDITDGAITQDKLNSGLSITGATPVATPPAASTTPIAKGSTGKATGVKLTAAQLLINQRIGQAAIRRLNALTAGIESGISASNLKAGSVTAVDLSADLRK